MRLLRPTNQKLKVTLCLGSNFFISVREIIEQLERLARVPGDKLGGIADGPFSSENSLDYLARNVILGSDLSGLACLNARGKIHGEIQLQKNEAYQEENKSFLTADSLTVPSLKKPKAEVRRVQCKKQDIRYIKEFFEQNFAKQVHRDSN